MIFSYMGKIKTLFFIFFLCFAPQTVLYAQRSALITIQKDNISVIEALQAVEKQTRMLIAYNESQLKSKSNIDLNIEGKGLNEVLPQILKGTGFTYQLKDDYIVIVPNAPQPVASQKKQIVGKVTDKSGEAIIGANIIEKGTINGTVTDIDGNFSIDVAENATLQISYIGYVEQTINTSGRINFNIVLSEDTKTLDELVVIGYGTVRRGDVTTAVSSVSLDDLNERPIVSAAQAIQGKAAGVNVYRPSGTPGGELVVRVRGTTSFNGSNDPLYVVDGVPVDNINFLSDTEGCLLRRHLWIARSQRGGANYDQTGFGRGKNCCQHTSGYEPRKQPNPVAKCQTIQRTDRRASPRNHS